MARNVSRIKLGYYPLPSAEGTRLRKLLDFAPRPSAVDPCAGTGAALHQLTESAEVEKHGVELDAGRAAAASANGITTVHGNLFDTIGKSESFSFLYLNPPYDTEIGSADNRRMEYLFLEHTFRWLVEGGVLLMVVPQERLDSAVPLLAGNFTELRIFRLTDPEAERFDQVALFGVRKRVRGEQYERNRALLMEMVWRNPVPVLTGTETPYRVPPSTPAPLVYRGLPLDQIEDIVLTSSTWKQVAPFLLPREEVQDGRPITPLHAGHVGLLCTAGLLNGVFGQGNERHIARWRTVKSVTVFEVKENGFKEIHKRERFTNELALIYEDGRTRVLGEEKKKEDCDAECASAPGAPSVRAQYGEDQHPALGPR
jgi:tRNA1(Val) A37 N6-methylase TrmN6